MANKKAPDNNSKSGAFDELKIYFFKIT